MVRSMVGGCCVCLDDRGWDENPLVYCDGHGCSVAVHQACYGIVKVPSGPWFCCKCQSTERVARVKCELCPLKDGALKRTDNGGWAHVVCALYIPEVKFGNVATMQPIILSSVPHERYVKTCYICEENGRESKTASGACMACNKPGCRHAFHVTCAQSKRLLCEEGGHNGNVQYVGYCSFHWAKKNKPSSDCDEQTKDKEKKPRSRQDSISSTNSDLATPLRPPELPAINIVKKSKKPPTTASGKSPCDPNGKSNSNESVPWQQNLFPIQGGANLPNNSIGPNLGIRSHSPADPNRNGISSSSNFYPVNHTHFKMEDLLKQSPAPTSCKASLSNLKMPNAPKESVKLVTNGGVTPASESTAKKRRVPSAKSVENQKAKKQKTLSNNQGQAAKVEQVKKLKKKAIKIQHTSTSTVQGSAALSGGKDTRQQQDLVNGNGLVKPPLLNLVENGNPTSSLPGSCKAVPESFQELLEFQWNEGTQFLMQKALNFDVASLLTCLHQLKSDNSTLETKLTELLRRRDRLLATNSRLSSPLGAGNLPSAMHIGTPLSAMLSKLKGDTTGDNFTNIIPPTTSMCSSTLPNATQAKSTTKGLGTATATEVRVKSEKKAPRPRQPSKKNDKLTSAAKKTQKQKSSVDLPATSTCEVVSELQRQAPSIERLMQPLLQSHGNVDKNKPLLLPATTTSHLSPRQQQEQLSKPFVIQSTGQTIAGATHLPANQRHSPSMYGSTQAALPQASGAVGFLVSQLQHPYSLPRIISANETIGPPGKIELARKPPSISIASAGILNPPNGTLPKPKAPEK